MNIFTDYGTVLFSGAGLSSSVEDQGFVFDYVVSDRVGRTNIKEQYGVIYRFSVLSINFSCQFLAIM